jgi:hypothetical protein
MIYPKIKKKIIKFAGGGSASLFDNPGTYLGVQYVQTAQNLPDVEGLQYIAQMEEAKSAKAAEKAKANADDMKEISKELGKLRGLTGEVNGAVNNFQSQISSFYQKYPTAESMNTNEAASDKARLMNSLPNTVNALLNSKDKFDKSYNRSSDVLGDIYTDGSTIMLQNPENPSQITQVSIPDYYEKKEGDYKGLTIMKNDDLFSWRMNFRQFGEPDKLVVDQYSEKESRSYINDHFDKIGQNSRTIDGAGKYAQILADAGLDPTKFSRNDLKVKISNGDINLETLGNSFVSTMDHKVLKSLISSILNNGENPYEKIEVQGMTEPVSKINMRIHEILTGAKASINSTIEIQGAAGGNGKDGDSSGGPYDVISNMVNRNVNLTAMGQLDPIIRRNTHTYNNVFNPYNDQTVTAKGLVVPDIGQEDIERLNGGPLVFKQIINDQEVYFNGKPVRIGSITGGDNKAAFYDTGKSLSLITFDLNNGNNADSKVTVIEKEIMVNKEGLAQFGFTPNEADRDTTSLVRAIYDGEIAGLPGISPELAESMDAVGLQSMSDSEHYLIRIRVPLSINAGHGGKSPGQSSIRHNSEINDAMQEMIKSTESVNNVASVKTQNMLNYPR